MPILGFALRYFGIVFAAGFVFGLIRVPVLVPRFGERIALFIEAPALLVVIAFSARWLVPRSGLSPHRLLAAGIFAASFVLAADVVVGVFVRDMTLAEIFVDRDAVTGAIYYGLIVVFALMPRLHYDPRSHTDSTSRNRASFPGGGRPK